MTWRGELDRLAALATLGVGVDASEQDILSAYRRLARSSHPDTAEQSLTSQDFAQINAAYRLLTRAESPAATAAAQPPAPEREPYPSGFAGLPLEEVLWSDSWPDDPPVVAGPVIIRPLSPDSQ